MPQQFKQLFDFIKKVRLEQKIKFNYGCEGFFNLNLVRIGIFEFDKEFEDQKLKKAFVNANALAIMFPYVRSFVTILTTNMGNVTGPLVIPTQFFNGDLPEISVEDGKE